MKPAHAIPNGTLAVHRAQNHRRHTTRTTLVFAERAVSAALLLAVEATIIWVLLSSIYLGPWPVH